MIERTFRPTLMLVLLVAATVTIAGCGSGKETTHTASPTAGVPTTIHTGSYSTIEINRFTTAEGLEKFQGFSDMVHDAVLQRLPGQRIFDKINIYDSTAAAEGTVILEAKVLRVKSVSRGKRFLLGVAAGRAGLEMEVSLRDKASGKVLTSNVILVKGSLVGGAFGAANQETIAQMTREILSYLRNTR